KPKALAPRQMLHAFKLTLPHPQTKEPLEFICPPPPDFINVLKTQLREVTCCIITGNPGSGKSQLTQFLADQGYLTCSADALVTKLYAPKGEVAKWLNLIAKDCVDENLEIERDRLMAKLKADSLFKRDFEAMIHAQVYAELEAFWQQPSSPNFTFAEVPLWFECGWHKKKSFPTICVYTPQDLRFKRLAENRGWSSEKAALLESWQWPETQKAKASTYIVDNSHSLEELKLKAQKLLQQLEEEYLKKQEASYAQLTCLLHLNSKPT
ncbi:MAG: dephospho-CoA kinase, partial [Desulfovibrionaceae bacterium]|nr:dephospho-CoA kinase [Desulfovibrionaceae bacterium]